MKEIECKEVIVSDLLRRGDGKDTPIRKIKQVFEKDGTLIAESDPYSDQISSTEKHMELLHRVLNNHLGKTIVSYNADRIPKSLEYKEEGKEFTFTYKY